MSRVTGTLFREDLEGLSSDVSSKVVEYTITILSNDIKIAYKFQRVTSKPLKGEPLVGAHVVGVQTTTNLASFTIEKDSVIVGKLEEPNKKAVRLWRCFYEPKNWRNIVKIVTDNYPPSDDKSRQSGGDSMDKICDAIHQYYA